MTTELSRARRSPRPSGGGFVMWSRRIAVSPAVRRESVAGAGEMFLHYRRVRASSSAAHRSAIARSDPSGCSLSVRTNVAGAPPSSSSTS
jgi:hypothetical protein